MLAKLYYQIGNLPDGTLPQVGLVCRTRAGNKAVIVAVIGTPEPGVKIPNSVLVDHAGHPKAHTMEGVHWASCGHPKHADSRLDLVAAWTALDEAKLNKDEQLAPLEPRSGEIER